jgi:membrane-associated protease RseP (regulator of RpoE activity)
MSDQEQFDQEQDFQQIEAGIQLKKKTNRGFLINILLFIITFFTTTVAGVAWVGRDPFDLVNFNYGIPYSISLIFVLGVHEFGHYFASLSHGVKVTLPFFIPFPPIPQLINFGTLGAVIRTRSAIPSKKAMFDIGVAGPIAGFIASLIVLVYGFTHLPPAEYILSLHPHFDFSLGYDPSSQGIPLEFGKTIAYSGLQMLLTNPTTQFVPPMGEIYHYPFLCVGWFGLFVTSLNLIPIGQFDGGHLIYTMFGRLHKRIANISFLLLLIMGAPALLDSVVKLIFSIFSQNPQLPQLPLIQYSWGGWFLWAVISFTIVKLYHPPVADETPIDGGRQIVGWLGICIFVVSFSFIPFSITF